MRRREFITLVGSAAAVWPIVAHALQPAKPVVGFLSIRGQGDEPHLLTAFHQGLKESVMSTARTSRWNTAGRKAKAPGYPRWQPIWFIAK